MASLLHSAMTLEARRTSDRFADCTLSTCNITTSYYFYRVSLPANVVFLVLFTISTLGFFLTYAFTRRALAFHFAMLCGVILEVIGYAGRIMSWENQWKETGFLMQIICLTIAPAFMAGGIYLCLRRIVYAFGPENSRISPEAYTRIFIPCDLMSLLLQAAGGGIASAASHSNKSPTLGDNIMVAGLAFQVFTLLIFMILCIDFALRTKKRYAALGSSALDQNPLFVKMRHSLQFKGFLVTLILATICIFWRSVYRVVELGEGWTGHLIREQWLFVGFEGVMVIVACLALNAFNPAVMFREAMTGLGGLGTKKKMLKQQREKDTAERSPSGSASDAEAGKETTTVV